MDSNTAWLVAASFGSAILSTLIIIWNTMQRSQITELKKWCLELQEKSNQYDREIGQLNTEIINLKDARNKEASDLNRRFDEIKGGMDRIENLVKEALLHRRSSDNHS